MSDTVIALLFSAGASGWIFSKISHRTGNEYKSTMIVTGVAFVGIFLVAYLSLRNFVH